MTLSAALRDHWPEYAIEAAGLGLFMLSACLFTVLLQPVTSAPLQRALMGFAMGQPLRPSSILPGDSARARTSTLPSR